jgi:hypothetical protein
VQFALGANALADQRLQAFVMKCVATDDAQQVFAILGLQHHRRPFALRLAAPCLRNSDSSSALMLPEDARLFLLSTLATADPSRRPSAARWARRCGRDAARLVTMTLSTLAVAMRVLPGVDWTACSPVPIILGLVADGRQGDATMHPIPARGEREYSRSHAADVFRRAIA